MKPPSKAPVYVYLWEHATEIARACGYCLAVHGSLARDLDLLACPWTDEAVSAEDLAAKLAEGLAWRIRDTPEGEAHPFFSGPVQKPHGRLAWTIPYMGEWQIDLSVMPRQPASQPPGRVETVTPVRPPAPPPSPTTGDAAAPDRKENDRGSGEWFCVICGDTWMGYGYGHKCEDDTAVPGSGRP